MLDIRSTGDLASHKSVHLHARIRCTGTHLEGEIYSGALHPPIERDDYLHLPSLRPVNGQYRLRLTNEVREVQHTNLAELWVIDHPKDVRTFVDKNGTIRSSAAPVAPAVVVLDDDPGAQQAVAQGVRLLPAFPAAQVVADQDNVAALDGHVGAAPHGDADIGMGHGRGVVDAIADKSHRLAAVLELAHLLRLVLGQDLGDDPFDPGLAADDRGRARVVAGDHGHGQPHGLERGHGSGRLRFQGVGQGQQTGGFACLSRGVEQEILLLPDQSHHFIQVQPLQRRHIPRSGH